MNHAFRPRHAANPRGDYTSRANHEHGETFPCPRCEPGSYVQYGAAHYGTPERFQ